MLDRIRKFENLHILLWLLKDTCWIMNWRELGMLMIAPTVATAFYISWLSRKDPKELMHNLAVCCWILANSIWMVGEFFFDDSTRNFALIFFLIGLALIGTIISRFGFVAGNKFDVNENPHQALPDGDFKFLLMNVYF
jgi:hypothetical protein